MKNKRTLCVVLQIILQRKVTLKSLLCLGVGIPFGYLVDLFMLIWNPQLFPGLRMDPLFKVEVRS